MVGSDEIGHRNLMREALRIQALLAMGFPDNILQAPDEEIDLKPLMEERDAIIARHARRILLLKEHEGIEEEAQRLEARLLELDHERAMCEMCLSSLRNPGDTAPITQQIISADETNRRVQQKRKYLELNAELEKMRAAL